VTKFQDARRALTGLTTAGLHVQAMQRDIDLLRMQLGGIESRQVAALPPDRLPDSEFTVFSQFGEDGIIQFLLSHVAIANEVFVEFGVENYRESNTRFLLVHDNWRGLIIDGGESHQAFIDESGLRWRYTIDALTAFIDRDNINDLIAGARIEGDIGLLSIDIDGNDYWVLEAIEIVSPRILVVEYNSVFGAEAAVTVPYDPGFVRSRKHWSYLYWGASIAALAHAAERKGFSLVGGNRAGNNAFFVRSDVLGAIPAATPAEAYAGARFRESRGRDGELSYVTKLADRLRTIGDMPIVDVHTNHEQTIRERYGLA
jgi:hypothetical protein